MDGDRYHQDGFFAEAIVADGPWEAKFVFCGKHGFNPADVDVEPKIRMTNQEYWCSVGRLEPGKFYLNLPIELGKIVGKHRKEDYGESPIKAMWHSWLKWRRILEPWYERYPQGSVS